jgi:hypothetical protein
MAIAVAAGKTNVLVDEVKSPSLFFKSMAITQLAKSGSEDHLEKLIIGAAPAVRTKVTTLSHSISFWSLLLTVCWSLHDGFSD